MKKHYQLIVCAAFVTALFTYPVLAQPYSETAVPEDMEVVSVQGVRSSAYYLREYERAKFAMYEAFNEINTIKEFTIDCRVVKPVGTQIAKKECLPRFYRDEWGYQSQMFMLGASNSLPAHESDIAFATKHKQKAFYQHIEELAKDSPELLAHLHNISNRLEDYLERKNPEMVME
ncbi:hypothetical protein [Alteromonas flava]|uniref:hypothetical protein n=1 Tax=Alteromonas flava TaxID=2048003 RepID=UPI000C288077|nr:hypothetical protein [Alteromonas flava]